jgi:hypothetical protein
MCDNLRSLLFSLFVQQTLLFSVLLTMTMRDDDVLSIALAVISTTPSTSSGAPTNFSARSVRGGKMLVWEALRDLLSLAV